ncbi:unnamed protein product, partial [Brenthis ino]
MPTVIWRSKNKFSLTLHGLQPTPINLLQPITPNQHTQPNQQPKPATKLGATWADSRINIDVDNLLGPRSPRNPLPPTINQLKSTPTSPAHTPNTTQIPPNPTWQLNNNFASFPPINNINNNVFNQDNLLQ